MKSSGSGELKSYTFNFPFEGMFIHLSIKPGFLFLLLPISTGQYKIVSNELTISVNVLKIRRNFVHKS